MSGKPQAVVVGSHIQGLFMRVPHLPGPDETVLGWGYREALDGGKGSHQAIALSRLGIRTAFVGCLGRDRFGEVGARWMQESGVDLTFLKWSGETHTGVGFVIIDPQGTAAIVSAMGANAELTREDVDAAIPVIAAAQALLTVFEIPMEVALYAVHVARRFGALTVLTPSPAEPMTAAMLRDVDLLVPNRVEAMTLLGLPQEEEVEPCELARMCQQRLGVPRVVVTLGEHGAAVAEGDTCYQVPTVRVPVVDTPGAGDAFVAGMVGALLRGCPLAEAVRLGCITGAYAVTIRESIPAFPTLPQLLVFARQYRVEAEIIRRIETWLEEQGPHEA
jgi:ribokinase